MFNNNNNKRLFIFFFGTKIMAVQCYILHVRRKGIHKSKEDIYRDVVHPVIHK